MNNPTNDLLKKTAVSQPTTRKSRSISRYFLGTKRSSIDDTKQNYDIYRCLISVGIFDSYDLWTNATLYRDYSTRRRVLIITNKNELIIGKYNHKHVLFKVKSRINLNRIWFSTNFNENNISEISSLNYYDFHRSMIIGWPIVENYIIEFDTISIRDTWKERFQSILDSWWQLNRSCIEHVRIVIDQNSESDQNNHNNVSSFFIRKVIGIRPEETVRDLIKKCIDAFHLQDQLVDNYALFVTNNHTRRINHHRNSNANTNSSSQSTQITNIPLIGHEYPFSIKMKHLKTPNIVLTNNRSFDSDDYLSYESQHNNSSTSLNNVTTGFHDFELRKRDIFNDPQTKKYRFFHKRKTKNLQQTINDDYHLQLNGYTNSPNRIKYSSRVFGRSIDELIEIHNQQLPPVIMELLDILYFKGPETTGIFRKVANARSVKECIEKVEHNVKLQDDDLHPVLAAGVLKHFLRSLPEPLFNSIQYESWKKCLRLGASTEKITFARKNILLTLSVGNHLLLKGFICVLRRISEHADTNGMNPFNLGLCVSNSLFKTESTTITSGKQEADVMSSIVEFLIENCSLLFGSDILTCIADKRIILHQLTNLTRPTASSIESLDEVESSPHLPIVNRSHDSGLAASDQPFNDDSSEISEYIRQNILGQPTTSPNWSSSIACGKGIVLTSIISNNTNSLVTTLPVTRRRSSKTTYKPSKQFLEREKLTNHTTDDSDNNISTLSSTTTLHNVTIGKLRRTKSLSRHASLGSNEKKQSIKEFRRSTANDVKRTLSLKQLHYTSDEEGGDDDDEKKQELLSLNEQKITAIKSKPVITTEINQQNEEYITTRSISFEQQSLDLTNKTFDQANKHTKTTSISLNPIYSTSSPLIGNTQSSHALKKDMTSHDSNVNHSIQPTVADNRSRHNFPLSSTTNKIYFLSESKNSSQRLGQMNFSCTQKQPSSTLTERSRTFVHHSNSRPFILGEAIQMKPIHDNVALNEKSRPCHRQSALRFRSNEREKRFTASPAPIKTCSYEINPDFRQTDSSWSVREKTRFFEHTNQHKLSTGRENYV